jgi:cell division protein FtsL
MAAAAQARRSSGGPRRHDLDERAAARTAARRAPQARLRAAQQRRLTRAFVVFIVCLTVLAVGRVSLSFALVQKSLQTDAVVREERRLSAENAQLSEDLAQLASAVRIRHIAESQLGLVDATHVQYLRVARGAGLARVAERP